MGHTVTVKLNKAANEFEAGESVGFNVRGGVQYYDRKTKEKEWTNYSAVVFVRNEKQVNFYREALIEGAVVELGCKQLKIDVYDGTNGQSISIEMIDAWVGSINQSAPRQQAQGAANPQPSNGQQSPPKVTQVDNKFDNFDDDIPF